MGSLRGVTRRSLTFLILLSLFTMNLNVVAQDATVPDSSPEVTDDTAVPPPAPEDTADSPVSTEGNPPASIQDEPEQLPPPDEGDVQGPPAEVPDELPPADVVLLEPGVQPDSCVDGVYTAASVSMSDDGANPAVTYQVTGPDANGQWSVLATLQPGYAWGDMSGTSWVILDASQATASGTVAITPCAPPPVVPDESAPPAADEGTDVVPPASPEKDATPTPDEATADTPDEATADEPMMASASFAILAASCDGPPYAAPTGVQIANPLNGVTITIDGVTYTDGAVIPFPNKDNDIQVNYTWGLVGSVNGGDYFQFTLPAALLAPTLYFPVTTPDGTAEVACASVVAGVVTVVFTDYVNGRDALDGAFSFGTELSQDTFTEQTYLPIDFPGLATFTLVIPPPIPPDTGLNQALWKDGRFRRADQGVLNPDKAIRWTVHLPARGGGGLHNAVVSDNGSGQTAWVVDCDNPPIFLTSPITVAIDYTYNCDPIANTMQVNIPYIPPGINVTLRWDADIVLNSPGPYNNTVNFRADEDVWEPRSFQLVRQVGDGQAEGTFWVVPVAPETGNGVCVGGTFTPPFVTLATTEGITYTMTPSTVPLIGGTVTVVASLLPEYIWDTANVPPGWVFDQATNTYSLTLELLADLCVDATPINPAVAQITCVEGTPTVTEPQVSRSFIVSTMSFQAPPTELVIPAVTPGITYTVEGTQAFGETVIVRAVLDDGYQWPAVLPDGWEQVDAITATLTIVLDNPTCETPTPTTTPGTVPPTLTPTSTPASTPPVTGLPKTGAGSQDDGHDGVVVLAALASVVLAGLVGLYRGRPTER